MSVSFLLPGKMFRGSFLFFFVVGSLVFLWSHLIDHVLNDHLLHINIEA